MFTKIASKWVKLRVPFREHCSSHCIAQEIISFLSLLLSLPGWDGEACYWGVRHREQIFQQLSERLSYPATYLTSNSPAVTLPATPRELCHWAVRQREQLLQQLPAERLSYRENKLPSNSPRSHSPSDSPRALSLPRSS
jgi:hypothetical protein